ncbi:MAG: hypothetical protein GKS05_05490 [Nitrospirales bacterium]|nr:hypothetical protein [Nitrospirales bacterium]
MADDFTKEMVQESYKGIQQIIAVWKEAIRDDDPVIKMCTLGVTIMGFLLYDYFDFITCIYNF